MAAGSTPKADIIRFVIARGDSRMEYCAVLDVPMAETGISVMAQNCTVIHKDISVCGATYLSG
jgi:hypothetical protein